MLKTLFFGHNKGKYSTVNEKNFFTRMALRSYIWIFHSLYYYYVLFISFLFYYSFLSSNVVLVWKKTKYLYNALHMNLLDLF